MQNEAATGTDDGLARAPLESCCHGSVGLRQSPVTHWPTAERPHSPSSTPGAVNVFLFPRHLPRARQTKCALPSGAGACGPRRTGRTQRKRGFPHSLYCVQNPLFLREMGCRRGSLFNWRTVNVLTKEIFVPHFKRKRTPYLGNKMENN